MTEPEARVMKFGGSSAFHPAYNVQVASTLDTGVIIAIEPTQDHGDWYGLQTLVPAVQKNTGARAEVIVADQGYGNVTTLDYADTRRIALYTREKEPVDSRETGGDDFCKVNSSWDTENKQITCTAGHTFSIYRDTRRSPGVPEFLFVRRPHVCSGCPLDGRCFPDADSKKKPLIRYRKRAEELRSDLRARMETEEGQQLYRMRSQCELQNANLKDRMRMQSFHVQGLRKTRQEAHLAAMAHNCMRWAALRYQKAA